MRWRSFYLPDGYRHLKSPEALAQGLNTAGLGHARHQQRHYRPTDEPIDESEDDDSRMRWIIVER